MRKTTQFRRMFIDDCYVGGIDWGTPIGSVRVIDRDDNFDRFDLTINDEVVMINVTASEIVKHVNKLIKEYYTHEN